MQAKKGAELRTRFRASFAERVIPIAFGLSVIGVTGVGFLAYYLLARAHDSEAWVFHTAVAISRLETLHRRLVEAESAGRAFLISGDPPFHQTFSRTAALIDQDLNEFKDYTSYNPAQQGLVASLKQHIARRFEYLETQIGRRLSGGFEAIRNTPIAPGVTEMEQIAKIVDEMKQGEYRLLAERVVIRNRRDNQLQVALGVLVVFGTAALTAIFAYMSRLWKERQLAEEKALRLAQHDTLTGLPNRLLLSDRVEMGLAQAKRYNEVFAILCLDLDGFKLVNDAHGHDAGDALLKLVAHRLRDSLRAVDTVARTGGDEFIVALFGLKSVYADAVASKIIKRISAPYTLSGTEVSIGTSIGIAFYPVHGTTPEELIKRADEALYEAKRRGKRQYQIANPTPDA